MWIWSSTAPWSTAALTALLIGLYILLVGAFGVLFQAGGNLLFSILATGLIAILFNPLRQRLQGVVNRMMYGERDDPLKVLSQLGQTDGGNGRAR